jgi:hypothetical protein
MPPAENSEAGRLLKAQPRDSASYTMADKEEERKAYGAINNDGRRNSLVDAADDEAIIPKGALDPVYEAKARILNRAVSFVSFTRVVDRWALTLSDSRSRHGAVSVGAFRRHRLWLGER